MYECEHILFHLFVIVGVRVLEDRARACVFVCGLFVSCVCFFLALFVFLGIPKV